MDPSTPRELGWEAHKSRRSRADGAGWTRPETGPGRGRLRDRREHLSNFSCNCANLEPPETDGNQHLQNSGSSSQKSETAGGKGNGQHWTTLAVAITALTGFPHAANLVSAAALKSRQSLVVPVSGAKIRWRLAAVWKLIFLEPHIRTRGANGGSSG